MIVLQYISSGKLRNCESTLASQITAVATSLTVSTGDGVKFPSYTPFLLQIESEILNCTVKATDTLTIERGAKGTTAATHATGTPLRAILYSNDIDLDRIICADGQVIVSSGKVVYD